MEPRSRGSVGESFRKGMIIKMKKRLLCALSLILVLLTLTLPGLQASAVWLSPLADQGDVNNDGIIQALDARIILRASARLIVLVPPSRWPKNKVYGDVNGDGKLTAIDARIVLRRAARIETTPAPAYANESELFLKGGFYMTGKFVKGGEQLGITEYAVSGKSFYIKTLYKDKDKGIEKEIEILSLNGMYLMSPEKNRYSLKQTDAAALKKALSDLAKLDNIKDIDFALPALPSPALSKTEKGDFNGVEYDCYTYTASSGAYSKHYRTGDNLNAVEFYDKEDLLLMAISIDSITDAAADIIKIPSRYIGVRLEVFMGFYN